MPDIARQVLPTSVYNRATRLFPPPVQVSSSNDKFVYGPGIPAPWNSSHSPDDGAAAGAKKGKDVPNGHKEDRKGEDKADAVEDARLFATWDYEMKDYRIPLGPGKKGRTSSTSLPHRPSISLRPGDINADGGPMRKMPKMKDGRKGDGKGK